MTTSTQFNDWTDDKLQDEIENATAMYIEAKYEGYTDFARDCENWLTALENEWNTRNKN